MFNWLHNLMPQAALINLGPFKIYWYGLIITLATLVGISLIFKLTKNQKEMQKHFSNLFFYLLIFGLIGARLYHVIFYNFRYFWQNPLEIFMLWHGGLAIYGAIIAGFLVVIFYTKKHRLLTWQYLDLLALVMPLGQAIGRWGNYFNQELFGFPCNFNWCMPISKINRPILFLESHYFHPVFLYESILNFSLFVILFWSFKSKKLVQGSITFYYLIGYSAIRFFMEFFRLDVSQTIGGLKWVQWLCLGIIFISVVFLGKGKLSLRR